MIKISIFFPDLHKNNTYIHILFVMFFEHLSACEENPTNRPTCFIPHLELHVLITLHPTYNNHSCSSQIILID